MNKYIAVKANTSKTIPNERDEIVEVYLQGDEDYLFPMVFPDYLVDTGISELPRLPLGHAGILIVNGKTGETKYYEYGRYDSKKLGLVRKQTILNLKIRNSLIDKKIFKKVLKSISSQAGKSGNIEGVILRKSNIYNQALKWLEDKMKENNNSSREPYSIVDNNCVTFVDTLAEDMGFNTPISSYHTPKQYIKNFQDKAHGFTYIFTQNKLMVK
ncbi:hypothetical protein RCS94_07130 [Orbaceae bacterium ac157xtp]